MTTTMTPDPITLELARRLPWSYADLHRALSILAVADFTPEDAARVLELAVGPLHPIDVATLVARTKLQG